MQVKVSEASACERTLEVTVEQQKVEGAYERAFGKAAKRLALPGFRRGKVPPKMARKYISDAGLGGDVVDDLVPNAFQEALRDQKLVPISEPRWELVQRERGQDLVFKVHFEVRPKIEVSDYKGMSISEEENTISEEQVESVIQRTLEQSSKVEKVDDRPLQEDDYALVDYDSKAIDGEADGGSTTGFEMHLNRDQFIPGFVDNLIGLEPGQEREFDIKFPDDYANTDLAGKEVHFHFTLHEVREKKVPELTDELVQTISPSKTVDELRASVREMLESGAERVLREKVAGKLLERLVEQVPEPTVPKSLHSYHTQLQARDLERNLTQSQLPYQEFLRINQLSHENLIGELQKAALQEARLDILLDSIAAAEDLHVTQEELDTLIENEARNRRTTPAALKREVEQQGTLPVIRYRILKAKVMDFLFEAADVKLVPPGTLPEESPSDSEAKSEAKPEKKSKAKEPKSAKEPKASKDSAAESQTSTSEAGSDTATEGEEAKAAKPKARKAAAKKKEEEA